MELLLLVCLVNLHSYHIDISDDEMREWVENNLEEHVIEENRFKTVGEIYLKFGELKNQLKYIDLNQEIEQFLMGKELICVPAVYCVLRSFLKMIDKLDDTIKTMNEENTKRNLKDILFLSTKFAVYFDMLYGAMLEDPNEIFYEKEQSDEVKEFFKHYEYHVPEDIEEHCQAIKKVEEEYDYMIAVASKGMWNESFMSQVFNTATYAIYYYFKQEECQYQAKFFMFLLKEDALQRILKIPQLSLMKRKIQKSLNPI